MPDGGFDKDRSLRPTDAEVADNYRYRERYEDADDSQSRMAESVGAAAKTPDEIAALVSPESHELMVDFEVGGRDGYLATYCHPEWPGGDSGITIGIGYDLGYNKPAEFADDWRPLLSVDDFAALRPAVGLIQDTARNLLGPVKKIVIPLEAAETVYRKVTVPKFGRKTLAAFPGCEALHPHCFGALFSLVYNRGNKMTGDRRVEMRGMRDAITAGKPELVPGLFRKMKHLWTAHQSGLWRRRDAEANLFQRGLDEARTAREPVASFAVASAAVPPDNGTAASSSAAPGAQLEHAVSTVGVAAGEDGDLGFGPEEIYDDLPVASGPRERAPGPDEWAHVHWVADDNMSTEYRHILAADRVKHHDATFLFTAADMDLLIKANGFAPLPTTERRIIFGLRGTLLDHDGSAPGDASAQVDRPALHLTVTRPDHRDFRCVMGVYDLDSQRLSGFVASTVPNREIVDRYFRTHDQGNMLTTGCYRYRVGAHHNGRYPGCLRQDEPMAVLRSRNDAIFDVRDDWDVRFDPPPMDNIHPAFGDRTGSSEFSSFGCQVIRGSYGGDGYTHEFAKFRTALGLKRPGTDNDRLFTYILLTGLDAVIAAQLRSEGRDGDPIAVRDSLARIRQGSRGEAVRALQTALGRTATDVFSAYDRQALVKLQRARLGPDAGDGIYSPAIDRALALGVFGDVAPAPGPLVVASLDTVGTRSGSQAGSLAESVSSAAGHPSLEPVLFEIGRRTTMARRASDLLTAEVLPHYEAISRDTWNTHVATGNRVVGRVERLAHELICNQLASEDQDRQAATAFLNEAIPKGLPALTRALSGVLTGWLAVAPTVATPIAEIIVARVAADAAADNAGASFKTLEHFLAAWGSNLFQAALAAGPASPRLDANTITAGTTTTDPSGRRL